MRRWVLLGLLIAGCGVQTQINQFEDPPRLVEVKVLRADPDPLHPAFRDLQIEAHVSSPEAGEKVYVLEVDFTVPPTASTLGLWKLVVLGAGEPQVVGLSFAHFGEDLLPGGPRKQGRFRVQLRAGEKYVLGMAHAGTPADDQSSQYGVKIEVDLSTF